MVLIEGWMPPNRENYDFILHLWTFYPLVASLQWLISWYGMGKTSVKSRLNLPGRIGWLTMECPGFLTVLYIMSTLPGIEGIKEGELPWQNKVLAGLFVIHYSYRAVAYPLIAPSMSPIHIVVWGMGLSFQILNGTCLGSFLAAYGPRSAAEWDAQLYPWSTLQFAVGIAVFYLGFAANYYHDDELREIRRREEARQQRIAHEMGTAVTAVEKHYEIPSAGLFKYMLYPHYFVEWVEWTGFYVAAGFGCVPARSFLINEFFAMLPRAVRGKQWYIGRFGAEGVGKRWAVIPGVW